jgi:hypothetical protein
MPRDVALMTTTPSKAHSIFEDVVGYIVQWIGLPQQSKLNKPTPVVLHGVIDTLNDWLVKLVKPLPNVHLLDTRNTLTLAEPGTTKASNDWMDEIHAVPAGWAKLAERWWNPKLEALLK